MKATILCFHKVGRAAEIGRSLNVDPDRLRQFAAFFRRRGYSFKQAQELAKPWPARTVCFTFDDAYVSAIDHAVPVLRAEGGTASFYAVPKFVGKASDWDGQLAQPLASWDMLRSAEAEGFEIGNHTFSHPALAELPLAAQRSEIEQGHEALIAQGLSPRSLCYPYGSHNRETAALCPYPVALALGKRRAQGTDNHRTLPRIVVAYGDGLPKLLYRIHLRPFLP